MPHSKEFCTAKYLAHATHLSNGRREYKLNGVRELVSEASYHKFVNGTGVFLLRSKTSSELYTISGLIDCHSLDTNTLAKLDGLLFLIEDDKDPIVNLLQ